jgi:hypothetical protein
MLPKVFMYIELLLQIKYYFFLKEIQIENVHYENHESFIFIRLILEHLYNCNFVYFKMNN